MNLEKLMNKIKKEKESQKEKQFDPQAELTSILKEVNIKGEEDITACWNLFQEGNY